MEEGKTGLDFCGRPCTTWKHASGMRYWGSPATWHHPQSLLYAHSQGLAPQLTIRRRPSCIDMSTHTLRKSTHRRDSPQSSVSRSPSDIDKSNKLLDYRRHHMPYIIFNTASMISIVVNRTYTEETVIPANITPNVKCRSGTSWTEAMRDKETTMNGLPPPFHWTGAGELLGEMREGG
jgi:hypothetical protein